MNISIMFLVFRWFGQPDMMHHASYLRRYVALEHRGDRYSTHGLPGANYSSISASIYWLQAILLSIYPYMCLVFRCSGQPDMMHGASWYNIWYTESSKKRKKSYAHYASYVSLLQSHSTNKITGENMKYAFLLSYLNSMGDWKYYLYLIWCKKWLHFGGWSTCYLIARLSY